MSTTDNENVFQVVKGASVLLYFNLYELISGEETDYTLTAQTLTLSMRGGNTPTTISKTCTYTPGTATCHCTLTAADTAIPGEYELEITSLESTTPYKTKTRAILEILDSQT